MRDVNAVGGGWTNQLAWGSDRRGLPMTTADIAESLFNSTEDHTGRKTVVPFATENDIQALLTMIAYCYLSGGNPTLFMDFRKVYEPWEVEANAKALGLDIRNYKNEPWMERGFIDGNNSGAASLDYAEKWFLFKAVEFYFPGLGFSVGYLSPKGIKGMAGRLAFSDLSGLFTMVQDEAQSVELPAALAERVCHASDYTWPHTLLTFDHVPASQAKMGMPANHIHMVTGLAAPPLAAFLGLRQHPQLSLGERAGARRRPGPAPADALPHQRGRDRGQDAPGRAALGRLPAVFLVDTLRGFCYF